MRKVLIGLAALGALGAAGFFALTAPAALGLVRGEAPFPANHAADAERGRTLFYAGGCTSCHATPDQPDHTRLGGGYALKSPFGTFHVPNISPHPRDGIGSWSPDAFVRAMREGTSPDGRHYYPAFPYTSYQRARPEDWLDVFAFLKTLPPVEGRALDHDLPFPFNIRRTLGGWKLLFLDGEPFKADASKSAEWNRGAYLVDGPAHCAECHSPRNLLGGIVSAQRFAGGPSPAGEGWVPNITQHGLKSWSVDQIARLLRDGELPDNDFVSGDMGKVVSNTGRLSEADQKAMAVYVKSIPAVEGPRQPQPK
jgi:mono/diheme cytochrome c family protein